MPDSLTARVFDLMLERQNYRHGDLMHEQLGDVEVPCPECHGEGTVDTTPVPFAEKRRECPACFGRTWIWRERGE